MIDVFVIFGFVVFAIFLAVISDAPSEEEQAEEYYKVGKKYEWKYGSHTYLINNKN